MTWRRNPPADPEATAGLCGPPFPKGNLSIDLGTASSARSMDHLFADLLRSDHRRPVDVAPWR